MSFKYITQLSFWNKRIVQKGKKCYILCLGTRFTNGNCMLSTNWLLAFCASRFYFAHWIFSWFMPFSMRCNGARFAPSWSIIIWRGLLYFVVFNSKYMCDWVLQMLSQTPLAKWVCMLSFTSAFKSSHQNSKLSTSSLGLFIT